MTNETSLIYSNKYYTYTRLPSYIPSTFQKLLYKITLLEKYTSIVDRFYPNISSRKVIEI